MTRCRSWRIHRWRVVRCAWASDHVARSRWHCATGGRHTWLVRERERPV